MNESESAKRSELRLEQASYWLMLTSGGSATEQDWLKFTAWLEEDELNRLAYDQLEDIDVLINDETIALTDELQEPSDKAVDVVKLSSWKHAAMDNWRSAASAITAVAAMFFAAIYIGNFSAEPIQLTQYSAANERRIVTLSDGSTLHLNVNTQLEMTMTEGVRQARLHKGEALFEVTSDRERPFLVSVHDQQIRVVGTVFNVLSHKGKLVVTVAEGVVEVAPASAIGGHELPNKPAKKMAERLVAGDQLIQAVGVDTILRNNVNVTRVTAWQDGYMDYENTALSVVVADLNRYFEKQILLKGNANEMRFSGVLDLKDQEAILALLLDILPIQISRDGQTIIINHKE